MKREREIHLTGAHMSALDLESSDSIAEVTCELCRDLIRRVGAAYAGARRNESIPWLVDGDSAREQAIAILEETTSETDRGRGFRRFDIRRWLDRAPGSYPVTLRVRKAVMR